MESTCWFRCCEIGPSASGGAGGTPSTPCVEYVEHVEQPRIGNGNAVGDLFGAAALRRQRVLFPSPVCRALHPPTAVLCATPQDAPGVGRRTLAFELFQRGSSSSVHLDSPLDCRRSSWIHHALEDMRNLMVDLVSKRQLQRASELLGWKRLNVYSEDPAKMTKIWSIQRQLEGNASMVVYLDTDVIIRPDSLHSGLVPLLLLHDSTSKAWNRSSRPGRRSRPQSPQSPRWYFCARFPSRHGVVSTLVSWRCGIPVPHNCCWNFGDKRLIGVLFGIKVPWAESLLELVGMEMQNRGQVGYRSQCLHFLFPGEFGEVPYNAYCDCWQDALRDMIGPYRQRPEPSVVSFVDPEELDVNFVPNDVFWDHGFSLEGMRLVRSDISEIMQPLIIHWAGREQSRHAATLCQRIFEATVQHHFLERNLFQADATAHAAHTTDAATVFLPWKAGEGAVEICRKSSSALRWSTFARCGYWGCCEWRPIKAGGLPQVDGTEVEKDEPGCQHFSTYM